MRPRAGWTGWRVRVEIRLLECDQGARSPGWNRECKPEAMIPQPAEMCPENETDVIPERYREPGLKSGLSLGSEQEKTGPEPL